MRFKAWKSLKKIVKNISKYLLISFYFQNSNKEKAAVSYQKAQQELAKFNTKASFLLQAAAWYNFGIVLKDKEGYPFVMDILTKHAIPLTEKAGDKQKLAHYYSQFGTILMYNAQFDKATTYNQKAIDLLKKDFSNSSTSFKLRFWVISS